MASLFVDKFHALCRIAMLYYLSLVTTVEIVGHYLFFLLQCMKKLYYVVKLVGNYRINIIERIGKYIL
jgi:hypothetical protein